MWKSLLLAGVVLLAATSTATASRSRPSGRALPPACDASTATAVVRAFVVAFNHGQAVVAARAFAQKPAFQWFSSNPDRLESAAYNRATLLSYFRARARLHEVLRVTQFSAGYDPNRRIVNFSGKLVRTTSSAGVAPEKDFKGAIACASAKPVLIVWSM